MAEKLRRRVRARALEIVTHGSGFLPHAFVRRALEGLAPLASRSRAHRVALENLEMALGDELDAGARAAIARGVLRHSARLFAEWIRLARGAPPDGPDRARGAWIDELAVLDPSVQLLRDEVARGRGALVVTAHLGNWELLAARLRREGFGGCVLGFERPNDSSHAWLTRMRAAYGVATKTQEASAREVLSVLRSGGVVGILPDLEARRLDGEFVPFFGRPALTMTAPAALARAAGVPLLPARCTLEGERYVLRFEAPLALDRARERKEAALDLLTRLNETFERWIRAAPEQWAWHQRRWRTRPGEREAVPYVETKRRDRAVPGRGSLQGADQEFVAD